MKYIQYHKNASPFLVISTSEVNNLTSILADDEDDSQTTQLVWCVIDTSLMLSILFGNILTICAVKLSHKLSSFVSNQFVLSLAVSDTLVGLMMPYHLVFYIGSNTLGLHKPTCLLRFMLISMACTASVFNMIAIAVDRYIAIIHPLHYNRYMTRKMASTIIIIGWTVSSGAATFPLFWNKWDDNNTHMKCEFHNVMPKQYVTGVMTPFFIAVWFTLLIVYIRIWRVAADHAKRLQVVSNYASRTSYFYKYEWKSVQVVVLVLGCFSICWLPYWIVVLVQAINERPQTILFYRITFSLAIANSGLNPLIYAWKNKGFRKAFVRLLHCKSPDFHARIRTNSYQNNCLHAKNHNNNNNNSENVDKFKVIDEGSDTPNNQKQLFDRQTSNDNLIKCKTDNMISNSNQSKKHCASATEMNSSANLGKINQYFIVDDDIRKPVPD